MSTGQMSEREMKDLMLLEQKFCEYINENYPQMVPEFLHVLPTFFNSERGYSVNVGSVVTWSIRQHIDVTSYTSTQCLNWIMDHPDEFELAIL